MRRKKTTFSNTAQAAKARTPLVAICLALALFALGIMASAGFATTAHPLPNLSPAAPSAVTSVEASSNGPHAASSSPVVDDRTLADADSSGSVTATDAQAAEGVTVTVTPDETRSVAPGCSISYQFGITNETTSAGLFDLSASGTAGFETSVCDLQGGAIASATLGAGETTQVVVTMSVPDTATVGTVDVLTLAATLNTSPNVTAQASAVTEVRDGLTLTPDHIGTASPNSETTYAHTLVNSWPTTRTVSLSYTDSHDWPVTFYAPDGVTVITSATVGPFGGHQEVLARVTVAGDASRGTTDTATIVAADDSVTVTATDTTFVRILDTYAGASDATPCSAFRLGDVVFARGAGLTPGSVVCFAWKDASGRVMQTSATSTVDASGTAADQYASQMTDPVGNWTVELREDSNEGPLIDVCDFDLTFKGEIVSLSANDGRNPGAVIAVASAVENETSQEITGSTLSYLMWWDTNGDGAFDAGDTYIDASGTPQPYSVSASTHVSAIDSVPASGSTPASGTWIEPIPWTITNTEFPNQGTYNVTAVWRSDTGAIIDMKTAQFFAIPTLGWPPFALLVGTIGCVLWRRRSVPHGEARRFGWSQFASAVNRRERRHSRD